MAHDVFISYAARDKVLADAVCGVLERQHIRCWIAPRDVNAGKSYAREITTALSACQVVIVLLSSGSNGSTHVAKELERALNGGKAILPVRIEDVVPTGDLEYYLAGTHWLDALTPPMEVHLEKVAEAVGLLLNLEVKPEPTPVQKSTPQPEVKQGPAAVIESTPPIIKVKQDSKSSYTEDLGNGASLEMVWIPEGSFLMGSPAGDSEVLKDARPQTNVDVAGFWMGKYQVTQVQYRAVMGSNPSSFKGDSNPVEMVSWNDAMEFCRELSQRTGQNYTLPTEAQWEYACRAGSTTAYSFSEFPSKLGNYAWFGENSNSTTHPVGGKQGNAWGLFDMHGNVWEWCLSLYKPYPYSDSDGRNSLSDTSNSRVLRGGSWYLNHPDRFLCAYRDSYRPDRRYSYSGFRCARTL